MAPMFAHLARDPVPSTLMKSHAPNVFRWDDAIPPTLEPVLRLLFQDWGPQVLADARRYNDWIAGNPSLPAGAMVSSRDERVPLPTGQRTARALAFRQGNCACARTAGDHCSRGLTGQ
jgi:hypothetical protein